MCHSMIETLQELNKSFSKKELINKYYTKDQKEKIKRLNYIRILFLVVVSSVIVTSIYLLIINSPSYLFYKILLILLIVMGLVFIPLAILIGNFFHKIQEEFGMAVLKGTFCKEIEGSQIRSVREGLEIVRLQRFKEFYKHESITITEELLSKMEDKLMKDLKVIQPVDTHLTIKWLKGALPFIVTSCFSVYLSRLKNVADIIIIFVAACTIIYTISIILFFVNTWRNDWKNKHMNKYQDILKTIENMQFELMKD